MQVETNTNGGRRVPKKPLFRYPFVPTNVYSLFTNNIEKSEKVKKI